MEKYLGVKLIEAEPMTMQVALEMGFKVGDKSNPLKDGYKVVYEDGYESWSPKDVFEKAYRRIDNLTFGLAIEALKLGHCVARKGWNGKNMYLAYVEGSLIPKELAKSGAVKAAAEEGFEVIKIAPHIDLRAANGEIGSRMEA
jgi:hypothetical protein